MPRSGDLAEPLSRPREALTGVKVSLGEGGRVSFWCPGCDEAHVIGPAWGFNDDLIAPTITGSVKVEGVQWPMGASFHRPTHEGVASGDTTICHSFVTDGRIQFLADSTHDLAGQTVDLPDWEDHKR